MGSEFDSGPNVELLHDANSATTEESKRIWDNFFM